MKIRNFKAMLLGLVLSGCLAVTACKSKPKESDNTNTTTEMPPPAPTPAPVVISSDDSLKTGVRDATKDYPGVNADVNNGEITLTGEIQRSKLPQLMMTLNSLRPKKINNNLTIK